MTLETQNVHFPFAGGLNEKVTEKWLEPGIGQRALTNVVLDKDQSFRKRNGFAQLSKNVQNGAALTTGRKLLTYRSEVDVIDGPGALFSYSPALGRFAAGDQVCPCVATRLGIAQSTASSCDADIAEGSGLRLYAWIGALPGSSGNVYVSLVDSATGAAITSVFALATGAFTRARALIIGTTAIVLYDDTAAATIYASTLDLTNPTTWSAPAVLTNVLGNGFAWDVCPVVGASTFILAANTTAGANSLLLQVLNTSLAATASANVVDATVAYTAVAVRATAGESVWVGYSRTTGGGTTVRIGAYAPTNLAVILAPMVFFTTALLNRDVYSIGLERMDATHVAMSVAHTLRLPYDMQVARISTAGVLDRGLRPTHRLFPLSRPFKVGTDAAARIYQLCATYVGAVTGSGQILGAQGVTLLVDLQLDQTSAALQPRPVAALAPRATPSPSTTAFHTASHLSSVTNPGSTSATTFRTMGAITLGAEVRTRIGLTECTLDFAHPGLLQSAELGESLYMAGGVPAIYDGTTVAEAGWTYYPDAPGFTTVKATVGGALAAQIYSYAFVWEWTDARGQKHQSAPGYLSVDHTASGTATNKATFTIPALSSTLRQEFDTADARKVGIVVYRTAWNAGSAVMGTILYRVTKDTIPTAQLNDPNAVSLTVADLGTAGNGADTEIVFNAPLYTTGNVLESHSPPSLSALWTFKGRVCGWGDDRKTVWYSTDYKPGAPVRFNDNLVLSVDDGGDGVAGAQLDDKMVLFKRDRIFVVYGDGPPETGGDGGFSAPQKIATDVGCTDPRSVVLTPMGLVFKSTLGIMLLDRSLQVQWIGKPVVDTLLTYPVLTSATLMGEQGLVLFTCNLADGSHGVVVVYDYVNNAWSIWQVNSTGGSLGASAAFVSAVNANGVYTVLTASGQAMQQLTGTGVGAYYDSGGFVGLAAGSAWFKPAGIQGFARCRRVMLLAENVDAHDITVRLYFDYESAASETKTWTAAQIATLPQEQLTMHISRQKFESIRVGITDADPGGGIVSSGAGPALVALSFEVGVKKGLYKPLSATAKG